MTVKKSIERYKESKVGDSLKRQNRGRKVSSPKRVVSCFDLLGKKLNLLVLYV